MSVAKSKARDEVERLVNDPEMSRDEVIAALKHLYFDARAGQRAATESGMVGDDGLNDDLRIYELALDDLGIDIAAVDEDRADSL